MISVILGSQWGDEAKGKLTDLYAANADLVVRFQGGNNAGHTIVVGDETFKLRLLPSGVGQGRDVVLGNGMVIDPSILMEELGELTARSVPVGNISISDRAHVILPYHRQEDAILEELKGALKAGTTGKGIGPCYADKVSRIGIRFADLSTRRHSRKSLTRPTPSRRRSFHHSGTIMNVSKQEIVREYSEYARILAPYVTDTSTLSPRTTSREAHTSRGCQGTHLDIDHGIYPYNTSSTTILRWRCTGAGIPPHSIGRVLGIVKAYTTRVGTGRYPPSSTMHKGGILRTRVMSLARSPEARAAVGGLTSCSSLMPIGSITLMVSLSRSLMSFAVLRP
jgi:adenylosuccinate synthase